MSDLVGNTEDQFSHVAAHLMFAVILEACTIIIIGACRLISNLKSCCIPCLQTFFFKSRKKLGLFKAI